MATKILFPNVAARNEVATFYGLVWDENGLVRQFTTNTFVAYVTANLDNYDTGAAAATAGGHFSLTFPSSLPAGRYLIEVFRRSGGSVSEAADLFITTYFVWWDGSALVEIDGVGLAATAQESIANTLLDLTDGVEDGETLREFLRLIRAVWIGRSDATDPQAGTVTFKRKDGSTTALTVTYNAQADRTAVVVGTLS